VISFDWVIRILLGDVAGRGQELSEHSWIRGGAVGAHLGRAWAVVERVGEESVSGREVSFLCDEDVDDLAELVNRPIQIDPSSGDSDIRFVDEPPLTGGMPAESCASISSGVKRCTPGTRSRESTSIPRSASSSSTSR
jgi:hypothetical protein